MTGRCWGELVMNNFSMFTADRMTHLKVVAVALVCATLVAGLGVAARVADGSADGRLEATVIKAGKPVTASTSESRTIR
jgi:ABC-type proline/glycine betaine transport system permease subunit